MNCTRLVITTSAIALTAALAAAQDAVLQWNAAALTAIRTAVTPPPPASRTLAILHASIHDAVNGIQPRYEHYLVFPAAPAHSSAVAAASAAAHFVLRAVYPAQSATFDALEATILGTIPDGPDKTNGILWGEQTAQQILAARANDGSAIPGSYPGSNLPGLWRPTVSFGGLIRPALLPQWGNVTPFALLGGSQFRPPAPPALNTFQYGFEVLQVQYFGGRTGSFRSAEQTETAHFWAYGPNTATPPGHWNQIAQQVAHTGRGTLAENARMFALLDIAMADAAIASWDCKYLYGLWRPITAIQLADQDGNALTQPDPDWAPLLETPPFPEYTSGHSTFSGAAAAVMSGLFGTDRVSFQVGSDDLPGVVRSYRRFSEAAWESGLSRIYGGIHFMSANIQGLLCGFAVGSYAHQHLLRPLRGR